MANKPAGEKKVKTSKLKRGNFPLLKITKKKKKQSNPDEKQLSWFEKSVELVLNVWFISDLFSLLFNSLLFPFTCFVWFRFVLFCLSSLIFATEFFWSLFFLSLRLFFFLFYFLSFFLFLTVFCFLLLTFFLSFLFVFLFFSRLLLLVLLCSCPLFFHLVFFSIFPFFFFFWPSSYQILLLSVLSY